jgi:hypothetical protein
MAVSRVVESAIIICHVDHNPEMRSILSNKWNPVPILTPVVTCMSDSRRGFGFDIGFTDHLAHN